VAVFIIGAPLRSGWNAWHEAYTASPFSSPVASVRAGVKNDKNTSRAAILDKRRLCSVNYMSFDRRGAMAFVAEKTFTVEGICIPDTRLAREITRFVKDTEPALLFHHSSRVYYWGALAGKHRGVKFDRELLYAGAMFHDMGLTPAHSSAHERFEVDGANAARDFLRSHGIDQHDIDTVWTAIALHTTPGIPQHMHPIVALVTAGVEMDVLGLAYDEYSDAERETVVHAHPRTERFKEDIIQAFYNGIKHKPDTTFGNVKADVLEDKDPAFRRGNFCSVIRGSAWAG
jgi:HD superfamily phosphodiesterase